MSFKINTFERVSGLNNTLFDIHGIIVMQRVNTKMLRVREFIVHLLPERERDAIAPWKGGRPPIEAARPFFGFNFGVLNQFVESFGTNRACDSGICGFW